MTCKSTPICHLDVAAHNYARLNLDVVHVHEYTRPSLDIVRAIITKELDNFRSFLATIVKMFS
ncbi:MAG: DUF86 domain-containing protein [Nitrospira sp.]|nr:DUF86 domain-containing protein [Nitrospira sp.]